MPLYGSVFGKSLLDRWRGVTIGVLSLAALLYVGMLAYQDIDLSIYTDLGPAFQSIIGIAPDADAASLAYNAILGSYGAIVMAGLAIAMGAAYFAGEERRGTIGVLLANPRSRTSVLVSKTGAMVVLIGLGGLVLWAAAKVVPRLLNVSVAGMDVSALTVHLVAISLFFGLLALAIGGWTGRTGAAAGISAGVLTVSFLGSGIVQAISGWEHWARIFPWYYFTGSDPLLNGIGWAHLAVLVGGSVLLFVAALAGVNRRDLRGRSTGVTLLDRLRSDPRTAALGERLAGSAQVSRIWVKAASEHRGMLVIVAALMFSVMGVLMGFVYTAVENSISGLSDMLPEAMMALFGGGDLSTPQGYFQIEIYGMVAPIALMVVTITIAAKALAGEEEDRTMGILLANPVPRSRVVAEKTLTMVVYGVIVGLASFAGVALGVVLAGVDLSIAHVAATSALVTLVGLVFGALALLVGAATGQVALAVGISAGAALVFHVMNALASLDDSWWGALSPFHYYLGSDPLTTGMDWGNAAVLAVLTIALIALAFPAFDRRDLRQHS
ncbi:MAG: ABC transporter permease subunit [Candidatus Nanopelagicales bacterium]